MENMTAQQIVDLISISIKDWHEKNASRSPDHVIVTEEIRRVRPLNQHRDDLSEVITELAETNTEIWHEEDKVRSLDDATVLKAIRNINPLNQHRNDLIEEVDEIFLDSVEKK